MWRLLPARSSMLQWRICCRSQRKKASRLSLVLCDGLEDPHNLGAVIRSALLCGAHGIVIPRRGSAQLTRTVLQVQCRRC